MNSISKLMEEYGDEPALLTLKIVINLFQPREHHPWFESFESEVSLDTVYRHVTRHVAKHHNQADGKIPKKLVRAICDGLSNAEGNPIIMAPGYTTDLTAGVPPEKCSPAYQQNPDYRSTEEGNQD